MPFSYNNSGAPEARCRHHPPSVTPVTPALDPDDFFCHPRRLVPAPGGLIPMYSVFGSLSCLELTDRGAPCRLFKETKTPGRPAGGWNLPLYHPSAYFVSPL